MLGDTKLLYKIAMMYYKDMLTQQEIADKLKISRPTISRALTKAEEIGIVNIEVMPPAGYSLDEIKLAKKLGLKRAIIAPSYAQRGTDDERRITDIAITAGRFIGSVLKNDMTIGLGWGEAVYRTVMEIPYGREAIDATFVPLVGSPWHTDTPYYQVNAIVDRASDKCRGRAMFINIPALVHSQQLLDFVMNDTQLDAVKNAWSKISLAVVGLGAFGEQPPQILVQDYSPEAVENLRKNGAVGDILGHFFTHDGFITHVEEVNKEYVSKSNPERVIDPIYLGIPVKDFLGIKHVLGVAGGTGKITAIKEASRQGFISMLVTDSYTASEILSEQ